MQAKWLDWLLWLISVIVVCRASIIEDELYDLQQQICGDIVLLGDGVDYISADRQQWTPFNIGKYVNTTKAYIFIECEQDIVFSINLIKKLKIEHEIEQSFRIRSGRHHFGGLSKCDGCIVIDVSHLNNINKFSHKHKEYLNISSGAIFKELIEFLKDEDIMIPHGNCQTVGVGGYAQSGGIGSFVRYYGLIIDYIIGINIVLQNGEFYQIIDKKHETKNLKTSILIPNNNNNDDYDDNDLQDILWAVRGAGGGNFGVVTNFIMQTFNKPNIFNYFSLTWSVTDDINVMKQIFNAYKWYFDGINNPLTTNRLTLYFQISPTFVINEDYPNGYSMTFLGVYVPKHMHKQCKKVDKIIQSIINKVGVIPINIEQEEYSYYEYFEKVQFKLVPPDPFPAVATSRLIQKPGWNDEFVNEITDRLYEQIVIDKSLYNFGYGPFILCESMGGNIEKKDKKFKKTSFDGRYGWNSMMVAQFLFDSTSTDLLNIATDKLLNDYDINVLSILGKQKYIGFMDAFQDINDIDTVYYPTSTNFNRLRQIKTRVDPH
eukprot:505655_1